MLIIFELFLNNGSSSELRSTNGGLRLRLLSKVTTISLRNALLEEKKVIKSLSYKKTGTTIVGVKYNGGVVLAADTRATGGSIVVEKNCEKIHYIAPNIYACGAGTAADTQFVNLFMSSNIELQRLNSGRQTRISSYITSTANLLYRYQGQLGAYLIVGGFDILGPHLVMLSAEGKYFVCYAVILTCPTQLWVLEVCTL